MLARIHARRARHNTRTRNGRWLAALARIVTLACAWLPGTSAADNAGARPPLEVMHWLTTGRDAAALDVVRERFVQQGGVWTETPMPGAGETGRAAAVSRLMGGRAPGVVSQFSLGAQLSELAAADLVRTFAIQPKWEAAIPPGIAALSRYQGRVLAVPVTIRGENWMFYNKPLLQRMGVGVPRTWPEFLATAEKLRGAGIVPLALGGQSWQERLLFNSVLLGVGGSNYYRRVYEQLDESAIASPTMLQVFTTFAALRKYVDPGSPGRRWSHTTRLVARGEAAFQIMGDWAKGEIAAANVTLGNEVDCALAPAPAPAYIMMVDGFAFAATGDRALRGAQDLFMSTLREPAVQAGVAQRLGSIPVRLDTATDNFDVCSAHAMRVVRDRSAQLMDPGLTLPGGLSGAIDDTISQFWNEPAATPEQGRARFLKTVRDNR